VRGNTVNLLCATLYRLLGIGSVLRHSKQRQLVHHEPIKPLSHGLNLELRRFVLDIANFTDALNNSRTR
jgi:hypothetical protein